MIAALLLGRKGSKGFPGKNTHRLNGQPMASYPMKTALDCPEVDHVYLSTDDEKLMRIAGDNGVDVIVRPTELCNDAALGEDAFVHGYHEIGRRHADRAVEFMVLLFCNAVTVSPELISQGVDVLRRHPEYDAAVSVSRYNMWSPLRARRIGDDGLLHPFVPFDVFGDPATLNCDRDSQGDVWFADMGVSVVRPRCLDHLDAGLLPQKWMGQKIYPLKQWGGLDVDYEWQLPQAAYWLNNNHI